MAIIATSTGASSRREPIPAGSYAARCYSMIQLGTNEETIQGELKRVSKVRITWELPTELKIFKEENGEQPLVISREFTLSMHEKSALRQFLQSWRGKQFTEQEALAFDVTALIGKPCLISISHNVAKNGNTYANITGVNLLPKGMECPNQINENQVLSFDNFNNELFDSLPSFIKERVASSDEFKAMSKPNEIPVDESDDIPF